MTAVVLAQDPAFDSLFCAFAFFGKRSCDPLKRCNSQAIWMFSESWAHVGELCELSAARGASIVDRLQHVVGGEMAFRELYVLEVIEILRLWSRGRSVPAIARHTGMDRKTVRRYPEETHHAAMEHGRDGDDELIAVAVEAVRPGAPSRMQ